MLINGLIVKSIAGFYYVESGGRVYECRARGVFRKDGVKPLTGDRAAVETEDGNTGSIVKIEKRKNALIRPPVANLDRLYIVISTVSPAPSVFLTDKLIAAAEDKHIEPVIVISKTDLACGADIQKIYQSAGFEVYTVSSESGEGCLAVEKSLRGHVSAFTGNSGVGKSSLLNRLIPGMELATGEISDKLGRGRHTTRHVELYGVPGGGYIADTPGFSSVDIERFDLSVRENLQFLFREFAPFLGKCRFSSCMHDKEKDCKIKEAAERGEIQASRYASYIKMLRGL